MKSHTKPWSKLRRVIGGMIVAFTLGWPQLGAAQHLPGDHAGRSPDEIIASFGLGESEGCLQFVEPASVAWRKERWKKAITAISQTHPDFVYEWIIGAARPPRRVLVESEKQRDCMLARMVIDAARPDSSLVIDWQKEAADKRQMSELQRRFEQDRGYARRLLQTVTESMYRDSRTQSWIWKRKFVFSGRNFNVVSGHAATICGIDEGHTWKPGNSRHEGCWHHKLSPAEREREILQASAAPGISRHHWGTDFDLFGLNPYHFRGEGRLADEYVWMNRHAVEFGFYQPYASKAPRAGFRYMEERWHWSYFPVGQALLEFAETHEAEVEMALGAQWDGFEASWNGGRSNALPFFSFVREHWRDFMFNVDTLPPPRLPQ